MGVRFEETMEITPETCAHKVRAMRKTGLDDQEELCYRCDGNDLDCGKYLPVSKSQMPIRRGFVAHLSNNVTYMIDAEG